MSSGNIFDRPTQGRVVHRCSSVLAEMRHVHGPSLQHECFRFSQGAATEYSIKVSPVSRATQICDDSQYSEPLYVYDRAEARKRGLVLAGARWAIEP